MGKSFVELSSKLINDTSDRGLRIGIVLFLIVKLAFVSAGAFSTHGARHGDDSYTYLWFMRSNLTNSLDQSTAVRSIEKFSGTITNKDLTREQRYHRNRVMLRVPGNAEIFLHVLMAPVTSLNVSFYTQYMISEIFVVIIMTLGIWCLFAALPRPPGLIIMLPLLALAFFPQQGLHFLIPSTLALSFGMVAWGLVLMERSRPVLLFGAGLLAMASHPIGIAHAAVAGFMTITRFMLGKITFHRALLEAIALLLVLTAFVALVATGLSMTSKVSGVTSVSISNLFYNIKGIGGQLIYFVGERKVEAFLVVCGIVAIIIRWREFASRRLLILILLTLTVLSCVYSLEDYPAEAAMRFLAPIFLIAFCHSLALPVPKPLKRTWQPLAMIVLACLLLVETVNYVYKQRDGGLPNIQRPELAKALQRMSGEEHIVYVDTDIALQTALLVGGETHLTSAWGLLNADKAAASKWLIDNPPEFLAATYPDDLLTLRGRERSLLSVRPYGFWMSADTALQLELPTSVETLQLRFEQNQGSVSAYIGDSICAAVNGSASSNGWQTLDLSNCARRDGSILLRGNGWIVGMATDTRSERVNWPWGQDISWTYTASRSFGRKAITLKGGFSFTEIDKRFDSEIIAPLVSRLEPFDDVSGVIFWRVREETR